MYWYMQWAKYGNLWLADANGQIWKMDTSGDATNVILGLASPSAICVGRLQSIWVTDGEVFEWCNMECNHIRSSPKLFF